ncbi:MAG: phage tail protein [Acidobacteriota bacterium]
MSDLKQLTDFPDVSIEDTISLTLSAAGNPAEVEFQLESAPAVTWWKALELRSSSGGMLNQGETHDNDHGPYAFSAPANDLVGARLTLAKAKAFGVHTGMYDLENLSAYQGRSLQFLWQRDDDRDGPVAGFFRDLGNGISAAANTVADGVETVVETVAEVVSTGVEAIGTAFSDALNAIGNWVAEIPVIGRVLRFVFHWLGTIASAVFDFVATVIKGVLDLVANVVAGVIRIVGGVIGGVLTGDWRLFRKGIGDVLSGIAGPVLGILGKLVALVQAVIFMQLGERPLTRPERDMLWRVYRNSVALYNVRVIDGFAGLFSTNTRPFTLGNKIYMKDTPPAEYNDALVHECCHVWQNQHVGLRYISDAVWAQATLPGQGYSWQDELTHGHFRWQDFWREAQAQFLQDIFLIGKQVPTTHTPGEFYNDDPIGSNVVFDFGEADYTGLARESVAYVRNFGWPWHRW